MNYRKDIIYKKLIYYIVYFNIISKLGDNFE